MHLLINSPLTSLPPCLDVMKKICYCGAPVWILPIALEAKNIVGLMTY